jgi:hypothetical protein
MWHEIIPQFSHLILDSSNFLQYGRHRERFCADFAGKLSRSFRLITVEIEEMMAAKIYKGTQLCPAEQYAQLWGIWIFRDS